MNSIYAMRFFLSITLFSLGIFGCDRVFSQNPQSDKKEVVAFSAGTGVLTFHGDVGSNSLVGAYSFIRSGYSLSLEKHLNKNISLAFNFLTGKLARDEKASNNIPKLNFESPITQFTLNGTYLFRKNSERELIPFISAGVSYLLFNPHGDQRDKNGSAYYYWKDGGIRDMPEESLNYFYAQNIDRDYKYETKITDSLTSYKRNTFALPLTAGIKMQISPLLDLNMGLTYHLLFSDYVDNYKASGMDGYMYSSASFTWHVFALPKKEKEQIKRLFAEIDNEDNDKDGILDVNDMCPGTPKDVKVDLAGCPKDSDADGIADHVDKQKNTKSGALVDTDGVELTTARIKEKNNTTIAAPRKDALSSEFNLKPSAEFMRQVAEMLKENQKRGDIKSNNDIPYELRVADWNKDGLIGAEEIVQTIDAFFEGSIIFSIEQVNQLIDFFFEQ